MSQLETTLEKIGRILSEKYGIRVVCRGDRCCTNGRTIYLPALPDDLPEDLSRTIHALVDHETGHLLARSDFKIGTAFMKKYGGQAFGVLNCLEDLRVERVMRETFPGSAANLAYGYRYAHAQHQKAVAAGEAIPVIKQVAIAVATTGMDMPAWPMVAREVYDAVTPLAPLLKQAEMAPSTKQIVPLAERVWEAVRPLFEVEARTQQAQVGTPPPGFPEQGDDAPSEGGTSSSGTPSQAGGQSRQGGRQDGTAQDQGNPGTTAQDQGNPGTTAQDGAAQDGTRQDAQSQTRRAPNSPSATSGQDGAQGGADTHGAGLLGDLGAAVARAITSYASAAKCYRPWTTENDKIKIVPDTSVGSHHDRLERVLPHVAGVRQKLLQTLLADVRARWLPDTERGHLNPRALHRLATAHHLRIDGAGSAAQQLGRRIFRQRVVTRRRDTAVSVLIDMSHSMANRKLDIARDTALVLCDALARLNIPVAMWGFSTEHHGKLPRETSKTTGIPQAELENNYRFAPLVLERFKHFDEVFRNISGRFDAMRTHMLTPLGEAMLFAAKELAGRREERKLLLVLTDGRPTVGMGDDAVTFAHARDSIARIEKAGIDVALVGILENCVQDLHHRAVVVQQLADLPGTVMDQLRQLLGQRQTTSYRQSALHIAA